jgi:hypothetical protein
MIERMAALWSYTSTREILRFSWRSLLGFLGLRDRNLIGFSPNIPAAVIKPVTSARLMTMSTRTPATIISFNAASISRLAELSPVG